MNHKNHYAELAERKPSAKAKERFRQPAYQAQQMIRRQGNQMQHKTVEEYLAEKYDIGGMDIGG